MLQEKVCELLSLHEKDYFGLRFIDTAGQTVSCFLLIRLRIKSVKKALKTYEEIMCTHRVTV